jgi:hypothetical protein
MHASFFYCFLFLETGFHFMKNKDVACRATKNGIVDFFFCLYLVKSTFLDFYTRPLSSYAEKIFFWRG